MEAAAVEATRRRSPMEPLPDGGGGMAGGTLGGLRGGLVARGWGSGTRGARGGREGERVEDGHQFIELLLLLEILAGHAVLPQRCHDSFLPGVEDRETRLCPKLDMFGQQKVVTSGGQDGDSPLPTGVAGNSLQSSRNDGRLAARRLPPLHASRVPHRHFGHGRPCQERQGE